MDRRLTYEIKVTVSTIGRNAPRLTVDEMGKLITTFQVLAHETQEHRTEHVQGKVTRSTFSRGFRSLDEFLALLPEFTDYELFYQIVGNDFNYLTIQTLPSSLVVHATMPTREQVDTIRLVLSDIFGGHPFSLTPHLIEAPQSDIQLTAIQQARLQRIPSNGNAASRGQSASSEAGLVRESRPVVFIGHGHMPDWRDLKDDLQDRCGYRVEHFNREEQAGHSFKDVLQRLLDTCNIAFLVMTPEDETQDGMTRARQNVVHEAGLFQGRHGFERAIIVRDESCEPFSNVHGIVDLRYSSGHIESIFHKVRDVIAREFPDISSSK